VCVCEANPPTRLLYFVFVWFFCVCMFAKQTTKKEEKIATQTPKGGRGQAAKRGH